MTAPEVLAVLGVRRTGRPGTWVGRCPLHDDRRPSLSVWLGRDGRLLLGCWSCRARAGGDGYKRDLLAKVGLSMTDLFTDRDGRDPHGQPRPHVQPRVSAVYGYCDEHGEVLYEKVRYEPKDFRLRRPGGGWGISGVRRVLYRLPELLAEPDALVVLVEGEKDAEAAAALGLAATTAVEGAGSGWSWDSPYAAQLRGRHVAVVPDEDRAGHAHARTVVGCLLAGGAASVRLTRLPGLRYAEHGGPDLSDWLVRFGRPGLARLALLSVLFESRPWGLL